MQRVKHATEKNIDELVNVYNFYLRSLKSQLDVKEHRDIIKQIIDAQIYLGDMQRTNATVRDLTTAMQKRVKAIIASLPSEYSLLIFSIDESDDDMKLHLDFYQLQKFKLELVLNGLIGGMIYNIDHPEFTKFIDRFCRIAGEHPLFDEADKINIGEALLDVISLRDYLMMNESRLQSLHDLIASLPGKDKAEQLELIKCHLGLLGQVDDKEAVVHCNEIMSRIASGKNTNLSAREKFCLLCAKRIKNVVESITVMRAEIVRLNAAIMASNKLFCNNLHSMADNRNRYPAEDWEFMETVMLVRNRDEVQAALAGMSFAELKHLKKMIEHPKVTTLINNTPLMKEHREEKFMRKRQAILGYATGRVSQAEDEALSLQKKFDKGKYKSNKKKK